MSISNISNGEAQATITTKLNSLITETNRLVDLEELLAVDDSYLYSTAAQLAGFDINSPVDWEKYVADFKDAYQLGMKTFLIPSAKNSSLGFSTQTSNQPGAVTTLGQFRESTSHKYNGNGDLESLGVNDPRWGYTFDGQWNEWVTQGYWNLPEVTNIWTETEPISSTGGSIGSGVEIVSIDYPEIPFKTAARLDNSGGAVNFMDEASVTTGDIYTMAVFLRKDDLTEPVIGVGNSSSNDVSLEIGNGLYVNASSSLLEPVGNGIWFAMMTIAAGASTTITGARKRDSMNPLPINVFGLSLFEGDVFDEIGGYQNYLNAWTVPTTAGTTATRLQDDAYIGNILNEGYVSSSSGDLIGTVSFQVLESFTGTGTGQSVFGLSENSDRDDAIIITRNANIVRLRFAIGASVTYDTTISPSVDTKYSKYVLRFDGSGHTWYRNGEQILTNATPIPDTFVNMLINNDSTTGAYVQLKNIFYSPVKISHDNAVFLSKWKSFDQMAADLGCK